MKKPKNDMKEFGKRCEILGVKELCAIYNVCATTIWKWKKQIKESANEKSK